MQNLRLDDGVLNEKSDSDPLQTAASPTMDDEKSNNDAIVSSSEKRTKRTKSVRFSQIEEEIVPTEDDRNDSRRRVSGGARKSPGRFSVTSFDSESGQPVVIESLVEKKVEKRTTAGVLLGVGRSSDSRIGFLVVSDKYSMHTHHLNSRRVAN